jgi:FtsH-binding integral membrane protein
MRQKPKTSRIWQYNFVLTLLAIIGFAIYLYSTFRTQGSTHNIIVLVVIGLMYIWLAVVLKKLGTKFFDYLISLFTL